MSTRSPSRSRSGLLSGSPHRNVTDKGSVIGVWTTAGRQAATLWNAAAGTTVEADPFHQVSRLASPLFNELLIPPLYSGVFPNLAKLVASKTACAELEAILLTASRRASSPGFQNYTGPADGSAQPFS